MSNATKGTTPLFTIGEKRATDSNVTGTSDLLGQLVTGPTGEEYRLVRLNNASGLAAAAAAKHYFKWSAKATFDVDVAGAATDEIVGVGVPTQVALDDNDFFYLQVNGVHTVVDSGSGVTAHDGLQAAATGEAVTDGTIATADLVKGTTISKAIATAAADADITASFLRRAGD